MSFAEEHGVRVLEQESYYRSQRCSSCGLVKKSNRKGRKFECSGCGFTADADWNAAKNHELELPEVGYRSGLNIAGFYWLESDVFDLGGGSLQSPL